MFLMTVVYTIYSYKIFLRWKELYKPPYVFLLGNLGLRIYNSPIVFYTYVIAFILFSLMLVSIISELSNNFFGISIILIQFLQISFFCFSREYSNMQHINIYLNLLKIFPISLRKKNFFKLYAEIIMPNIISLLVVIIGILIQDFLLIVKLKLLFFTISLYLLNSIISFIIPRKKTLPFSFAILGILFFSAYMFITISIYENTIRLEYIDKIVLYNLPYYYILCTGCIALFIVKKFILVNDLCK